MPEPLLSLYEDVARASGRMRAAACERDWEGLVAAEAECAARIARLRAAGDGSSLAAADLRRKNEIIRRVLADDAEIRSHLQPWMAKLETLLAAAGQRRRVQQSYGG